MRIVTGSPEQRRSSVSQVVLPSFLEPPVRWRTPPIESICEPYSAVVTWPTSSPATAHRGALRAEVPVGVDLHLHAAVGEDPLRHHGDGVHAFVLGGDDEGRGLVVRIGGAGADAGDEGAGRIERRAVPLARARRARACRPPPTRLAQQDDGIGADEPAVLVGVARAGAGAAGADAAEHGTGVAADDAVRLPPRRTCSSALQARGDRRSCRGFSARRSASCRRWGRTGTRVTRTPVAWRIAPRIAGAVATRAGSPTPLAP